LGRQEFNSTLHQSSQGLATRVHGFSTKTKALVREILPATQAINGAIYSEIEPFFALNRIFFLANVESFATTNAKTLLLLFFSKNCAISKWV